MPSVAFAHPGNTAADGCHYCRTNCDKWGEAWGERHCHGGYTAPAQTYTPPKTYCPANSTILGTTCYCNNGYAPLGFACHKIPSNAHESNNGRDAWECDEGYIEKGNKCIAKPLPIIKTSAPIKSIKKTSTSSQSSQSSLPQTPEQFVPNVPVDKYKIECKYDSAGKCVCPRGYHPLSNYSRNSKLKGKQVCSIL